MTTTTLERSPSASRARRPEVQPAAPPAHAPRVLILSASAGVGHLRAAEAVELAVRELHPDAEVTNADVLALTHRAVRHFYARTYFDLIRVAPHLVGYVYDKLDKPAAPGLADRAGVRFRRSAFGRVTELVLGRPWDVVINTHFLPAEIVGGLRDAGRTAVPQVMVTTDFYIHRMWVKQPVERYYAASEESAVNLRAHVPAGDVEVTGIPIHPAFAADLDPLACRRKHGLPADRPVVLQLAGGCGVGPIEQVHRGLLAGGRPVHVVVAAGRNAGAKARLDAVPVPPHHGRTVLGFTTEMHELMAAADVVVSKPGGLTTSEALATGTPMVVVDPIPGQECRNSDYLLEHGAAVKANTLHSLPFKLEEVLGNPARLRAMRAAARALGTPDAGREVARRALELVGIAR